MVAMAMAASVHGQDPRLHVNIRQRPPLLRLVRQIPFPSSPSVPDFQFNQVPFNAQQFNQGQINSQQFNQGQINSQQFNQQQSSNKPQQVSVGQQPNLGQFNQQQFLRPEAAAEQQFSQQQVAQNFSPLQNVAGFPGIPNFG